MLLIKNLHIFLLLNLCKLKRKTQENFDLKGFFAIKKKKIQLDIYVIKKYLIIY